MRTLAVILILVGVLMLAYQTFTYTKDRDVIDIGPIEAKIEEKETIAFPPILGIMALGIGVVLLLRGRRSV